MLYTITYKHFLAGIRIQEGDLEDQPGSCAFWQLMFVMFYRLLYNSSGGCEGVNLFVLAIWSSGFKYIWKSVQ